jgi:glycosyltransferase involved in cell wall biosynthesis
MLGPRYFPSRIGGVETQVFEMSKRIAQRDHEGYVLVCEKGDYQHENIHIIEIPHLKWEFATFSLTYLTYNFFSIFYAIKAIKKYKIDILHANSLIAGCVGVIVKRIAKVPLVYTLYGTAPDNIKARGKLLGGILVLLERRALIAADIIISPTKYILDTTIAYYNLPLNARIIPSGIDITKFLKGNSDKIKGEFGIKDEKVILFVGRLVSVKGLDYLLMAMKEVVKECPTVRLFIVGDGPLEDNLRRMTKELDLEDNIIFTGIRQDIPDFLAASDVVVLPSLHEGMPNVVLEAMVAGRAVVTSNITSMPEIIKHGETGLLIEPKNPEKLRESLLLLLKNEELRKTLGENAKKISRKYSWDVLIDEVIEGYKACLRSRRLPQA